MRASIEQAVTIREQRADAAVAVRREALQRKVENGEALTRKDLTARKPVSPETRDRVQGLRRLTPAERAEALRDMTPEERRLIVEELRARRAARRAAPTSAPSSPETASPPSE